MNPWAVHKIAGGATNQPGVRSGPDAKVNQVVEAVVLAVYYPDEDDRIDTDQTCITCDVRTIGRQVRHISRVPVFQPNNGLFDEDSWVPRASTQDITGGTLQTEVDTSQKPTPAQDMDGDHVLVGFLDGAVAKPFIWPISIPHPVARNRAQSSDGRRRRIRYNGVLIEIDNDGNLLLDARGAAKEALGPNGTEVSNSGTGGTVKLITKDATGAESQVYLDQLGNVEVADGGTEKITFTHLAKAAKLESGATIELNAAATLSSKSPSHFVTGPAGSAVAVAVDAVSIVLAPAAATALAATLVQHTGSKGWLSYWTAFNSTVQTLKDTFDPAVNPPPAPTSVGEINTQLLQFFTALLSLGQGFLTSTTTNTLAS